MLQILNHIVKNASWRRIKQIRPSKKRINTYGAKMKIKIPKWAHSFKTEPQFIANPLLCSGSTFVTYKTVDAIDYNIVPVANIWDNPNQINLKQLYKTTRKVIPVIYCSDVSYSQDKDNWYHYIEYDLAIALTDPNPNIRHYAQQYIKQKQDKQQ
jgi:hypothetical protein